MQALRGEGGILLTCHIGKHKVPQVIVLSIPGEEAMGCVDCWRERGRWCDLHDMGHQGFVGGHSACIGCIEEEVDRNERFGKQFLQEARKFLPADDVEELNNWLTGSSLVTGQTPSLCFIRLLATRAMLLKLSVRKEMQRLRETKTVLEIIPPAF